MAPGVTGSESEDSRAVREELARVADAIRDLRHGDVLAVAALVDRLDDCLSNRGSLPPEVEVMAHVLAVEILAIGESKNDVSRTIHHLDAVRRRTPAVDLGFDVGAWARRERALVYCWDADHRTAEESAAALEALEDALTGPIPETSSGDLGTLAYNAARERLRLLGNASNAEQTATIKTRFRQALGHYTSAKLNGRAGDAAVEIAEVCERELKDSAISDERATAIFREGWRATTTAFEYAPVTDQPIRWAQLQELAARLLSHRPGFSRSHNAKAAIKLLEEASLLYRFWHDPRLGRCAVALMAEMIHLPSPWSSETIDRFRLYCDMASAAISGDELRVAIEHIKMADCCAEARERSSGNKQIAISMTVFARRAYDLASSVGHDGLCAISAVLLGNSLAGVYSTAQEASDKSTRERLGLACESYERARAHATRADMAEEYARASQQLAVALCRRFISGEDDKYATALEHLDFAAQLSTGQPLATCYANKASLLIEARRRGVEIPVDAVRKAASNARELRTHLRLVERDYLNSIDELVELVRMDLEGSLQAVTADLAADGTWPQATWAERLSFRRQSLMTNESAEPVVVLLWFEGDYEAADGIARLSTRPGALDGVCELSCPHCSEPAEISLPIIVAVEDTPDIQKSAGSRRHLCRNCGRSFLAQCSFVVNRQDTRERPIVVYPDALAHYTKVVVPHQQVVLGAVFCARIEPTAMFSSSPFSGLSWMLEYGTEPLPAAQRSANTRHLLWSIVTNKEETLRQALGPRLPLVDESAPPLVEREVAAVLADPTAEIPDWPRLPDAEMTELANAVIEAARQGDMERAVAIVRTTSESLRDAALAFSAAAAIAEDPAERRAFLEAFLDDAPDYSVHREMEMRRLFYLGGELALLHAEGKGLPETEPDGWNALLALSEQSRERAAELMRTDRFRNTSTRAKSILRASLAGNMKFVLLLRPFALDVRSVDVTDWSRQRLGDLGYPHIRWQATHYWTPMTATGSDKPSPRVVDRVIARLPENASTVTVANVADVWPPEGPAKLFVTEPEWRTVAFSLIAEAAAIVLTLPRGQADSYGGLIEERAVIAELHRDQDVIAIADDIADTASLGEPFGVDEPSETTNWTIDEMKEHFRVSTIFRASALDEQFTHAIRQRL